MRAKRQDRHPSIVVFDDRFVAEAAHHEPTARERFAAARRLEREAELPRRRRRGPRWTTVRRLARGIGVGGLLLAGLVVMFSGLGTAVPNDPRPRFVRTIYAVPSDVPVDPTVIPGIQRDVEVTQNWLAAQTGGRSLRFVERDGATAVDVNHLTVTAAQLQARPDAAGLINDEFRRGGAPDELMLIFVPVRFSELIRCGEAGGHAIVWMGSCGATPSTATTTFGEGTTSVIAHELMHVLGAVQPCAPHYGNNGHVTDDPRDLLYDGPMSNAEILLDPGHDDYYATGNSRCPDVATHPAWQRH